MTSEPGVEPPIDPDDADKVMGAGVILGTGLGLGMAALFGIGMGDVVWGAISGACILVGFAGIGFVTEGYDGW